jgi:Bax protein
VTVHQKRADRDAGLKRISGTAFAIVLFCLAGVNALAEDTKPTFTFENFAQVEELFNARGYTQAAWEAGIRMVPRLIIQEVPSRWRNEVAGSLVVADKKRIFFRMLGPLILIANERIGGDRSILLELIDRYESGTTLNEAEQAWLQNLATQYKVAPSAPVSTEMLDTLLNRVDIIPPSLAMAQSAEESGWGTSRFADLGNALFGQWTWSGGIEPLDKRADKGSYGIARFDTPLESVEAYMRNLNTHSAYAELRKRRAEMHATHALPDGYELARSLTRYSERGEDYVHSLHAIMRVNKLQPADEAFLGPEPPLYLVPVNTAPD